MAIQAGHVRGGRVPHLQILEDERVVMSWQLRGGRTVIGRSDRCDVALPGEAVSRVHCHVEKREGAWWLVDKSRHGTLVDGHAEDEVRLAPGARIGVGAHHVRFIDAPVDDRQATVTRVAVAADHEELIDLGERCAAQRVVLVAVGGPRAGDRIELSRTRVRLGGEGAHVLLDDTLPGDAVVLRLVRGRALVEPGTRPVFLGTHRVRELTPVLDGDVLRLGDHALEVRSAVVEELPRVVGGFGELVGSSPAMQHLFHILDRIARHDATVLLCGESGTGKELAARAIHEHGVRCDRPFVAVNCASIPEHLVEAELFGHEAGAFTGAATRRDGAFQRADGGTLFLDELGEMSADVQAKLLRVLESGEVHRVGGRAPEFPDVRVVAATHRDLAAQVEAGRFRRDLLFRLAVLTVHLPPLRHHPEDVGELATALLARHHPGATLSPGAVQALQEHPWVGNVRELRNVLTRAVVLRGPRIEADHLTFDPFSFRMDQPSPEWSPAEAEAARITEALRLAGGNRAEAARQLGLARTSLLYKMRKHGIAG